jgi:hypothetical protein
MLNLISHKAKVNRIFGVMVSGLASSVKPKTIKLVFDISPLRNLSNKSKDRIKIMGPSGMTRLP